MKIRLYVSIAVVLSVLLSAGNALVSIFTRRLVDDPHMEWVIALGMIWGISALISTTKEFLFQRSALKRQQRHESIILKKITLLPFPFLESKLFRDEQSKIKDLSTQEKQILFSAEALTTASITVTAFCLLSAQALSARVFFLLLAFFSVTICLSFLVNGKLSKLMYDFWSQYIQNTRSYNYITDVLTGKEYTEERAVYNFLPFFSKEFAREFDSAAKKNRELGKRRIRLEMANDGIYLLSLLFVSGMLLFSYLNGQITIGYFVAMLGYLIALLATISGAVATVANISQYRGFAKECQGFLDREERETPKTNLNQRKGDLALLVRNVVFQYPTAEKPILQGLSFSLEKGKKYAIIGANGCGKTTLAKLLSGLYTPTEGEIERASIPVVLFQDFNRYPATLEENVILKPVANAPSRLSQVEAQAGLDKLILEKGIKNSTELTNMKKGGRDLSGGEWQRVALARILWQNADFYILDEPTASLDPLEEIRVFRAYDQQLAGKTVIYITHRLGFVKHVDQILVIQDGVIAESGTHDELCQMRNGIYKKMYEEQKHWYEE